MMRFTLPLFAVIMSLVSTQQSQAELLITMYESGSDVVVTVSGSIDDLTGTTLISTQSDTLRNLIRPERSQVVFGESVTQSYNIYNVGSVPVDFGTTFALDASSSTVSSNFLVRNTSGNLFLPTTYVLGTEMSGTATYAGQSFASLGITPGTYLWTWTGDSVTLNIGSGPAPVPEPGTWAAAALLAGGAAFMRWRKRAKVS